MATVNNVTRLLDALGIQYHRFELPPEKLGALETARLLGAPPESVFKTIVVLTERRAKSLLVLVPGTRVVDLKKVAVAIGERRVRLPSEREAETITGLQAGGISPLALRKKGFRVLIDDAARHLAEVHISGGRRGLNIRMKVDDLVEFTDARFGSLSSPGPHID